MGGGRGREGKKKTRPVHRGMNTKLRKIKTKKN